MPTALTRTRKQLGKVTTQGHSLESAQVGDRFHVELWQLENSQPKIELLFVHGAIAHCRWHQEFFHWILKSFQGDLALTTVDLVGHGSASGARAYVERFSHYQRDILTAAKWRYAQFATPRKLLLMGHSMGGLACLKALLEDEALWEDLVEGVILSNPAIRPKKTVHFPGAEDALEMLSRFTPMARLPRVHKGLELNRDADEANRFETDPLIANFITARLAWEIWQASRQVRPLSYFLKFSSLFVLSGDDRVVDNEACRLFARGIDKRKVSVLEYPEMRHEVLNETGRVEVWEAIAHWIEQVGGRKHEAMV